MVVGCLWCITQLIGPTLSFGVGSQIDEEGAIQFCANIS